MIKAEIVAHSRNQQGDELISVLATFPRIILSEMNTHRMLSKNTSSSRAIPFKKMVESVQNNPFIPIAWQKHHSGMQGNEYWDVTIKGEIGELDHTNIPAKWLRARDTAVTMAEVLHDELQGVTKQLANRLLEPFMWTTMLITGPKSGWDNFFRLRCPQYKFVSDITGSTQYLKSKSDWIHIAEGEPTRLEEHNRRLANDPLLWLKINKGQAEIHIMDLAEKIYDAVNESTPKKLEAGEWHIPFGDKLDSVQLGTTIIGGGFDPSNPPPDSYYYEALDRQAVKVSTAMAARTSYTVVGEEKEVDYEALIGLHDRLIAQDPPHSSPLEHCARAMSDEEHGSYIKGKIDLIDVDEPEYNGGIYEPRFSEKGWCNNFKGFIPYRYLVDNSISL